MDSQFGVVVKVFVLSGVISLFIKYVAPSLAIPATVLNALIAIALPSLILALFFWQRSLSS